MALAQAADGTEELLHRRGLAQHFCSRISRFGFFRRHHRLLEGAANQLNGIVDIEGFSQVLECPPLKGGDGAVQIRVGGHDDDRQIRLTGFDLGQ